MLHPYIGSRTREHFGPGSEGHSLKVYGFDRTGKVTYAFNSLGFRCKEFSAEASAKIYFCGCSATFCVGLDVDDSWPYLFAKKYTELHALNCDDLCIMNFSQAGCSNKYISRTLVSQSHAQKPDLIVAMFTFVGRTDFLIPQDWLDPNDSKMSHVGMSSVGPWLNRSWLTHQLFVRKTPKQWRKMSRKVLAWVRWYYRKYSEQRAVYETLIDIALLRHYCLANGIQCLICCLDHDKIRRYGVGKNPAVAMLYQLVEPALLSYSISDPSIYVDKAVDGFHPGPIANQKFAEKLWESFLSQSHLNAATRGLRSASD